MIRRTCMLTGRVQGVGMRFAVRNLARTYAIAGYVENTDDGRVRIVLEGTSQELSDFLERLQIVAPGHIHSIDTWESAASGEFDDFEIRR
ncbi:MAG: acylphosphatase [Pirellula sp.]